MADKNKLFSAMSSYYEFLDDKLEEIREKYAFPALGATLLIQGDIKYTAASGVRKLGAQEQATKDDKWHLGSCTKSMVSTLAAILIEQEKYGLSWSLTLGDIFDFYIHPDFQDVTLAQLFAHRSGILDIEKTETPKELEIAEQRFLNNLNQSIQESNGNLAQARKSFAGIILSNPRGYDPLAVKEFQYSNVGYMIAGSVLETLAGQSWEQLLIDEIFNPLDMTSCGFGSQASKDLSSPDQPWGHSTDEEGNVIPHYDDNPQIVGPAGIVHCSQADWLKYINLHIDGYLGRDTILLSSNGFSILHTDYMNQGYTAGGWGIDYEDTWVKDNILHHSGSNGNNLATITVAPKLESAIVIVANSASESPDAEQGADKALIELIKAEMNARAKTYILDNDNINLNKLLSQHPCLSNLEYKQGNTILETAIDEAKTNTAHLISCFQDLPCGDSGLFTKAISDISAFPGDNIVEYRNCSSTIRDTECQANLFIPQS